MADKQRSTQIAHVLFLDIVGYSRENTGGQSRMLESLNECVQTSDAYMEAQSTEAVHPLPTSDGTALLFYNDVLATARFAVEPA